MIQEALKIVSEQFNLPWPTALTLVIHALNNKPHKDFKQLSPFQIMFGCSSRILDLGYTPEKTTDSQSNQTNIFGKIQEQVDRLNQAAEERMAKTNQQLGGKQKDYPVHSLVYLKDQRLLPKKKTKQLYYSTPHVVIQETPYTLLVKNFMGQTKAVHKDNVRPCPARTAELFNALPFSVKRSVGFPFTEKDLKTAIIEGRLPEFWEQEPEKPVRRATRGKPIEDDALLTEEEEEEDDQLRRRVEERHKNDMGDGLEDNELPKQVHFEEVEDEIG